MVDSCGTHAFFLRSRRRRATCKKHPFLFRLVCVCIYMLLLLQNNAGKRHQQEAYCHHWDFLLTVGKFRNFTHMNFNEYFVKSTFQQNFSSINVQELISRNIFELRVIFQFSHTVISYLVFGITRTFVKKQEAFISRLQFCYRTKKIYVRKKSVR